MEVNQNGVLNLMTTPNKNVFMALTRDAKQHPMQSCNLRSLHKELSSHVYHFISVMGSKLILRNKLE